MAISNQVSLPGTTYLNAAARKDKPEVKWLGRTVHEASNRATNDRLFAIIGLIMFVAGLML
ncbi:MAG: hypothetical protein LLG04_18745, partial [Parachlamydia sp.]|nr:hypothetical protein [Parachlamydia sp.]